MERRVLSVRYVWPETCLALFSDFQAKQRARQKPREGEFWACPRCTSCVGHASDPRHVEGIVWSSRAKQLSNELRRRSCFGKARVSCSGFVDSANVRLGNNPRRVASIV